LSASISERGRTNPTEENTMSEGNQKVSPRLWVSGLFCTFFLVSGSVAFAGWTGLIAPDVSLDWSLNKVSVTAPFEGWAVGKDVANGKGVLLRYADGSLTEVSPPDVSNNWVLSDVHLTSSEEGWAVGADRERGRGVLLHYLNPDWTSVAPPEVGPAWSLEAVHFSSPETGWAVGSNANSHSGLLLGYGAGLWTVAVSPAVSVNWELFGVHFPVDSEGWAVGRDGENGRGVLLHYAGGAWQLAAAPDVSLGWGLKAVYFISPEEGWAVGDDQANGRGVILHYTGGSWRSIVPPDAGEEWDLQGVHFTSTREGWAAGFDYSHGTGVLLRYLDGVWTLAEPPGIVPNGGLTGVQFLSPYFGIAVGGSGSPGDGSGVVLQYLLASPEIKVVPNVAEFGNVLLESFAEKEITVSNIGFSDLILFSVTDEVESPFSRTGGDCESGRVLAPGEECTMTFQFTPASQGTFTTEIMILSNDPSEPESIIPLKGGAGPDLFGQWKEFSQDCKTRRGEIRCEIRAIFEVRNIGNLQAASSVAEFYLSDGPILNGEEDTLIGSNRIAKLKAAKGKDVKLKLKLRDGETPAGKYLIAVVDAHDDVSEANETNNVALFGPIP
jgi:hypothetical protein